MTKWILNKSNLYCILFIVIAIFAAYFNIIKADFISWDDADFTFNNSAVREFNIRSFFSNYYLGNYVPLTMVSFSIDYYLGQDSSWVYHLHNIFLHVTTSVLVFFLFNELQSNKFVALFTALIFALHSMQTESVVWISERKNLLSGLFYLSGLIFYLRYLNSSSLKNYLVLLLIFITALFSKGMAVSFPIALFAIDLWLNRLFHKKIFLEKIPFFILSLIFGIIAIKAQTYAGFLKLDQDFSFPQKLLFSGYAFMLYVLKLFVPIGLSAIYPYPKTDFTILFFVGLVLFISSLLLLIYAIRKNKKMLAGGLLFFAGNIIFVLQLIKSGAILMADHYIYIAGLGIIFPFTFFIFNFFKKTNFSITVCSILAIGLLIGTHLRNNIWKNGISFWRDIVKKYPNSEIALSSLGAEYMLSGENSKAFSYLNSAINLNPNYLKGYYNRGLLYAKNNRLEEALKDFTKATELKNYSKAFVSRAEVYYTLKDYSRSLSDAETVLKTEPDNVGANFITANCYSDINQLENALVHYNKCIILNSKEPSFYFRRAIVLGKMQRFSECLDDLVICTDIDPRFAEAYYWKGVAKVNLKQDPCTDFQKAISFGYTNANGPLLKYCK
ncbi:MAG TPA: tetratricopeptide repeat protein [Bacteroidia bacterium]|jgi:hypothetical protein|nr:tetratricopeptide repeat protein [Bacteroidia bacterium]